MASLVYNIDAQCLNDLNVQMQITDVFLLAYKLLMDTESLGKASFYDVLWF